MDKLLFFTQIAVEHIKEGTNLLLFLFVLLLPAPLLKEGDEWGKFGGIKYSMLRIGKVLAAFIAGHVIALASGASALLSHYGMTIEILTAITLVIASFHAIKPFFSGKEIYMAAAFGLVQGMVFAGTMTNLVLVQGFLVALTVPSLMILNYHNKYNSVLRISAAVTAIVAALGWIAETVSGMPNMISMLVDNPEEYLWVLVLVLALVAGIRYFSGAGKHTISELSRKLPVKDKG